MWCLVVDELLEILTSNGIRCQAYADDIVILARGKVEETLCDIIKWGLRLTKEWCLTAGLNLNPAKTTIVPFTRKRKLERLIPISLSGTVLNPVKEVKYLGITLDSKHTWKNTQIKQPGKRRGL